MTTTDTDALTERIAESLCEPAHRSRWPLAMITTYCGQCWENATTVAAVVAEEVRKAKAEALREAARDMGEWADESLVVTGDEHDESTWREWTAGEWLEHRATEHETGDSDEHR